MQKTFPIQPHQQEAVTLADQEHRDLLARYGSLMLEKARIKKSLKAITEKKQALLRGLVQAQGISEFTTAHLDREKLVVEVPEPPPPSRHTTTVEAG